MKPVYTGGSTSAAIQETLPPLRGRRQSSTRRATPGSTLTRSTGGSTSTSRPRSTSRTSFGAKYYPTADGNGNITIEPRHARGVVHPDHQLHRRGPRRAHVGARCSDDDEATASTGPAGIDRGPSARARRPATQAIDRRCLDRVTRRARRKTPRPLRL